MKIFGVITITLMLASSAFAQAPGLFARVSSGFVFLKTEPFSQKTSTGETLKTGNLWNSVPSIKLMLGYKYAGNWDIGFQFTRYETAEVGMNKSNGLWGSTNAFRYLIDTNRFALVSSYNFAVAKRIRLFASAGVISSFVSSRMGAGYSYSDHAYPSTESTDFGYIVSLGAEWVFNKHFSLGLTGAYSPYKWDLPQTATSGYGTMRSSTSSVKFDAYELGVVFTYRL